MPVSDLVLEGIIDKGRQADFVLGQWSKEETSLLIERYTPSCKSDPFLWGSGLKQYHEHL